MNFVTAGVVLHTRPFGERDLILTLLTPEHGKITALARSVGKNKKHSVLFAQPFTYSNFVLFQGKGMYIVDSADVVEPFYALRLELTRLALAQYLVDVAAWGGEGGEGGERCSLLLNSLYLLSETDLDETVIKMVFEVKFCLLEGLFPEVCCNVCGNGTPNQWSFSDGFYCGKCGEGIRLTPGMVSALRHIAKEEGKAAYRFEMNADSLAYLACVTGDYISCVCDKVFDAVSYYESLKNPLQ